MAEMAKLCMCSMKMELCVITDYYVCTHCDRVQAIEYTDPDARVKTWQEVKYQLVLQDKLKREYEQEKEGQE